MSRNMLDMSHVGYDIKLSILNVLQKCTVRYSLYVKTITILPSILFASRRVVAGAVSKGSSLWVNASFKQKWMPLWLQFSRIWHRRSQRKRGSPHGHPFCCTWSQRKIWWKPINFHRHLLLANCHILTWNSVGMVPKNLVSGQCWIAGQIC